MLWHMVTHTYMCCPMVAHTYVYHHVYICIIHILYICIGCTYAPVCIYVYMYWLYLCPGHSGIMPRPDGESTHPRSELHRHKETEKYEAICVTLEVCRYTGRISWWCFTVCCLVA